MGLRLASDVGQIATQGRNVPFGKGALRPSVYELVVAGPHFLPVLTVCL
jgi:hypothetical protein